MESFRWAFNSKLWLPKKEECLLALSLIQMEEKDRIMKYVFQRDAKASLVGRLMIRKLVSEVHGIPWADISLSRDERGRPFVSSPSVGHSFDFNISHQGDLVVLAAEFIGLSKIGIDVMKIESPSNKKVPEFFRLMRRQFTQEEWSVIKKDNNEQLQLKAFYRNWCLKEALVKSLGVGISYDLQSLSFKENSELTIGECGRDTKVKIDDRLADNWVFQETLINEDHIVTTAFVNESKTNHVESSFTWLTFSNLVQSASKVIEVDQEVADEFMNKAENPYYV